MEILIATGNLGKLREFKQILEQLLPDVTLKSLKDFPEVEEPIEDGKTFLANAYLKCMYYYNLFKIPTIADDTGLCVKALNNAPGVYSARYGSLNGEHTDPVKNCERILSELNGIKDRYAEFNTAMYFYDGKTLISSMGKLTGSISLERSGNGGFGYDPIFFVDQYNSTLGELPAEVKNKISHRYNASMHMAKQLKQYLNK